MTRQAEDGWAPLQPADRLRTLLQERYATHIPSLVAPRRAAVAAVLRPDPAGAHVLLMRRAERPGDRWSGQISMPGGMADPGDDDLLATAVREAREELGLALQPSQALGRLDDQIAMAKGRVLPLAITPYVFAVDHAPMLSLNHEATTAFWLPLAPLLRGELDTVHRYTLGGLGHDLPAWRYEGHVIWGLTHRMLLKLVEIAAAEGATGQGRGP